MSEPTKEEIRQAAEFLHKKHGKPVAFYVKLLSEDAFASQNALADARLKRRRKDQHLPVAA